MRTLLEHTHEHGLSRDEMAYLAGNLFSAGSETACPDRLIITFVELTLFPQDRDFHHNYGFGRRLSSGSAKTSSRRAGYGDRER